MIITVSRADKDLLPRGDALAAILGAILAPASAPVVHRLLVYERPGQ